MQNQLMLSNTRLTADHLLSGAIASALGAGALNFHNYKNEKVTKNEAIKDTLKLTAQGGIAAGSAISCSNNIVNKNYTGAVFSALLGFGAIVAIEKIANSNSN